LLTPKIINTSDGNEFEISQEREESAEQPR